MVFRLRIVNLGFQSTYDIKKFEWERNIINKKIASETEEGILKVIDSKLKCMHGVFIVPKAHGSRTAVVDCSKPKGSSANNTTSTIACKFRCMGLVVNHPNPLQRNCNGILC